MQLTLILDKSAFQSLGYAELYRLCQYYKVVITPILVTEILGDLSKEAKEGSPPSETKVIEFAKKLFVNESVVIMDYKKIVHMDLVNHNITLDRRPIVDINRTSTMGDQSGFEVKESDEEKSIKMWKAGHFTEAERVLSKEWRTTTTEPFALEKLKQKYSHQKYGLSNIGDVLTKVDEILNDPSLTEQLLFGLFENYEIPARDAVNILQDWRMMGKPLLKDFSQYSYHCLRVDILFIIGLNENLIGTRSTNAVDLKYLYHLPFSKIFTSSDNFHKLLVPILLESDQIFIEGQDLKLDISQLVQYISSMDEQDRKGFYKKPPINEDSFTYRLWRDFYGYNTGLATWQVELSKKEIEDAKQHMSTIINSFDKDIDNEANIGNADYIVRHSIIKADGPCFCKSGNNLVGCCMTSEQFAIKSEISFLRDIQIGRILPNEGEIPSTYEEREEIIKGLRDGRIKPQSH